MSNVSLPRVAPDSFLTLHYRLAAPSGADFINTFADKPATLSLGTGQLSPAIEQHLLGLTQGTRSTFVLEPEQAFGPRKPELMQWVARDLLDQLGNASEQYQPGDVVQFPTPDGQDQYAGVVQQLRTDEQGRSAVQFDFNHPLAGQAVVFEVEVIAVL